MQHLRPAITLIVLFTLLTGIALPLGFVGLAGAVMPFQARGSLIQKDGKTVGSALIGQNWTQDKYLQGRQSATTAPDPKDATKTVPAPYNAANSGASNAGPTAKSLIDRVTEDANKMGPKPVPGDAVTTSASGLDPHISPAFAARQVARIAKARNLPETQVQTVIAANTEGRLLGLIGEPRVNVLAVNLALDGAAQMIALTARRPHAANLLARALAFTRALLNPPRTRTSAAPQLRLARPINTRAGTRLRWFREPY